MNKLFWHGCLHLEDAWAKLREPEELEAFLSEVTESNWNLFIEGPPEGKSDPHQLLTYLARSMSGGPISNSRIISDENGRVRFWARSKNKGQKNRSRPFQLSAKEFVRRWSMHILPKGYTRSRCYGGYHGTKRKDYLNRCRQLLPICHSSPLGRAKMGSGLICVVWQMVKTCRNSARGRPGNRKLDSSPSRFAVACCQIVSPNGVPQWALRRKAFNSASVSA